MSSQFLAISGNAGGAQWFGLLIIGMQSIHMHEETTVTDASSLLVGKYQDKFYLTSKAIWM